MGLYESLQRGASDNPWRRPRPRRKSVATEVRAPVEPAPAPAIVIPTVDVVSWDAAPGGAPAPAEAPAPSPPTGAEAQALSLEAVDEPTLAAELSGKRRREEPAPQPTPTPPPVPTTTPWNAYVYIIGTDVTGRGDFNEMRKLLQQETQYEFPWVAITYDFKNSQIRKFWKQSSTDTGTSQTYPLGTDFGIVYSDITAMPGTNQRIRHLHLLTHFGNDRVYYMPNTSTKTSDLDALPDKAAFKAAFASDAVCKIHGCQQDTDLVRKIYEFAVKGTGAKETRDAVRERVARSFPVKLSEITGVPVWAAPMGAYAIYECSYLSAREKGHRFCVETTPGADHSYETTIRFYEANYDRFFDRAQGEAVFDHTFHLKFKWPIKTDDVQLMAPAAALPAAQEVREQELVPA